MWATAALTAGFILANVVGGRIESPSALSVDLSENQRVFYVDDGDKTETRRGHSQDCHEPLCIRVSRREFGPPVPFHRAVIFLGVVAGAGIWLSYLLARWLTNIGNDDDSDQRSDDD